MKAACAVMLDTGPLSLVTQRPGRSAEVAATHQWMADLARTGVRIYVPEVTDYELRRKLLHLGHSASVKRLDAFNVAEPDRYVPVTTAAMRLAAGLWAQARRDGLPTAPPESLDVDVILAAQALTLGFPGLIVVTTNPAHLSRFVAAEEWRNIVL